MQPPSTLQRVLDENSVADDPFTQFVRWRDEALAGGEFEVDRMALATADATGRPAVRMVLMRGLDDRGLMFVTNFDSAKAADLAANPHAEGCFLWDSTRHQVRVGGRVERVDTVEAENYFHTRPRGSQLAAWASPQSRVITRTALEERFVEAETRFAGEEIPMPPFWGGFRLLPEHFEFWEQREHRLHDRVRYDLDGGSWTVARLAP